MNYQIIQLSEQAKWQTLINRYGHSFYHTWQYCNIMQHSSGTNIYLALINFEDGYLLFTFCERVNEIQGQTVKDIYSPYGIAGVATDTTNWKDALTSFLRANNYLCCYIQQSPNTKGYEQVERSGKSLFFIDYESKAKWFEQVHKNHKRNIKKLTQSEYKIERNDPVAIEQFPDLYLSFVDLKQMSKPYHLSEQALKELIASPQCHLFSVCDGDQLINASLFCSHQLHADFMYTASSLNGRQLSTLVLATAIEFYLTQGIPVNLGGGIAENDNLALFKRKFGAIPAVYGEVKVISDKELYRKLTLNNHHSSYFPAYLA